MITTCSWYLVSIKVENSAPQYQSLSRLTREFNTRRMMASLLPRSYVHQNLRRHFVGERFQTKLLTISDNKTTRNECYEARHKSQRIFWCMGADIKDVCGKKCSEYVNGLSPATSSNMGLESPGVKYKLTPNAPQEVAIHKI
jgi:hypothetical protein